MFNFALPIMALQPCLNSSCLNNEKLTDFVHPLVLGEVYRSKAQIQMMAEELIKNQVNDAEKTKKIIAFLCSESGSHDYTINRREAKNELGLNIKNPSAEQYSLIKRLYDDINAELLFNRPAKGGKACKRQIGDGLKME